MSNGNGHLSPNSGSARCSRLTIIVIVMAVLEALAIGGVFAWFALGPTQPPRDDNAKRLDDLHLSWDEQTGDKWLYRTPFKTAMRGMWVQCNRIVSAGRPADPGQPPALPNFEEIAGNARPVVRKSNLYAGFWETIRDGAKACSDAAAEDDWLGANTAYLDTWNACIDCHTESWSPAYLHVTFGVLRNWRNNDITPQKEQDETDFEPPPKIPNRDVMKRLDDLATQLSVAIAPDKRDAVRVREACKEIVAVAETRVELWRRLNTNAVKLLELATSKTEEGMEEAYTTMTSACVTCHAANVADGRPMLNPMTWRK